MSETAVAAPATATTRAPQAAARSLAAGLSLWNRAAWRDATLLWLGQHALLLVVAYIGRTLFLTNSRAASTTTWGAIFHYIGGWDTTAYAYIARHGYTGGGAAGFSPLLPALEHIAMVATGADPVAAGIVISNVALLIALGLLRVLVERELGAEVAHRTLLYLVLFPTAFFFDIAYTESLFLLFSVVAFLALRGRHWLAAGLFAALAVLTRTVGIALAVPILVECARLVLATRERPSRRTLLAMGAGLALPFVALAGFSVYLYTRYGSYFAAASAQEHIWGKGLGIPFIGFARAGGALLRLPPGPNYFQAHILLDGGFTLLATVLTLATWRRLPPAYALYSGVLLFLMVALPAHNWYALSSNMRYMLDSFPLFMLLGRWGERRDIDRWILVASVPLLALLTLIFLSEGWVA